MLFSIKWPYKILRHLYLRDDVTHRNVVGYWRKYQALRSLRDFQEALPIASLRPTKPLPIDVSVVVARSTGCRLSETKEEN